jgi:hypothetical protein
MDPQTPKYTKAAHPVRDSEASRSGALRLLLRLSIVALTIVALLSGFYISLVGTAKRLNSDQKSSVVRAIDHLRAAGFDREVLFLENFTAFRSSDNWLNASVAKENAYAATNFPFEIMTLYPDFFTYPVDDVERAAILLHEARHLLGDDEKEAYEFVWRSRKRLGWVEANYWRSPVWSNVREQTRDAVPGLFVCEFQRYSDCTDDPTPLLAPKRVAQLK